RQGNVDAAAGGAVVVHAESQGTGGAEVPGPVQADGIGIGAGRQGHPGGGFFLKRRAPAGCFSLPDHADVGS
ncbi:hypothetical protein TI06_23905, partial [Vibrio vulnificus]